VTRPASSSDVGCAAPITLARRQSRVQRQSQRPGGAEQARVVRRERNGDALLVEEVQRRQVQRVERPNGDGERLLRPSQHLADDLEEGNPAG
jgi:hypothetical protein